MDSKNQKTAADILFSLINRKYAPDDVTPDEVFNRDYYATRHQNNIAYQANNWFGDNFVSQIERQRFSTVFELGSGNGQATKKLAEICDKVIACDWSPNPYRDHKKVEFYECSFFDLPDKIKADVSVSADVIEHFPPEKLNELFKRLDKIAPKGLHIIAGYGDGHSHLSVFGPWDWLKYFRNFDDQYKLVNISARKGNWDKPVFVFSNFL